VPILITYPLSRKFQDTDRISRSPVRVTTFILANNCHFRGGGGGGGVWNIYRCISVVESAELSFQRTDAFGVEKVKLAMHLLTSFNVTRIKIQISVGPQAKYM